MNLINVFLFQIKDENELLRKKENEYPILQNKFFIKAQAYINNKFWYEIFYNLKWVGSDLNGFEVK